MKPNQLILLHGGYSLKEQLEQVKEKIKNKFVIGMNYSFEDFDSTLLTYVDYDFYKQNIEKLKELPLIIGNYNESIIKMKTLNTIMLSKAQIYKRDLSNGVYRSNLAGLFALSLGIYLLDEGEIFLLGADFGSIFPKKDIKNRFLTHYYQDKIHHRGIGKISYYTSYNARRDYKVYVDENKIKIYNVGLLSNIPTFEKIGYPTFFNMLDDNTYNQEELRTEIKNKIKGLPCIK